MNEIKNTTRKITIILTLFFMFIFSFFLTYNNFTKQNNLFKNNYNSNEKVKGIDSLVVPKESITSTTIEFILVATSDGKDVEPYYVGATAKINKETDVEWFSKNSYEKKTIKQRIEGLSPDESYTDISFQLYENDKTTPIGNPVGCDDIKTKKLGKVIGIDNATVNMGSQTERSFTFNLTAIKDDLNDLNEINYKDVQPYKIEAFNSVERNINEVFWVSKDLNESCQDQLTIDNLKPATLYKDISFQLIDNITEEEIGEPKETNQSITTLSVDSKGIDSASIVDGSITSNGFSINLNVLNGNSSNNENEFVNPFKLKVFANGDDENEIWTSPNSYYESGDITVEITNLETATQYKDIKIGLFTKDILSGELVDVSNEIITLDLVDKIDNVQIIDDSITPKGFDFIIDIKSENDLKNVDDYQIETTSLNKRTGEDEVIWTSLKINVADKGIKLTIGSLDSQTNYYDIKFKLLDSNGKFISGTNYDTNKDVLTTYYEKDNWKTWQISLITILVFVVFTSIFFGIYLYIKKSKPNKTKY